jgi:hypothetical protein
MVVPKVVVNPFICPLTGDKDPLSKNPETLKKNGITCQILTPNSFLEADDGN